MFVCINNYVIILLVFLLQNGIKNNLHGNIPYLMIVSLINGDCECNIKMSTSVL